MKSLPRSALPLALLAAIIIYALVFIVSCLVKASKATAMPAPIIALNLPARTTGPVILVPTTGHL